MTTLDRYLWVLWSPYFQAQNPGLPFFLKTLRGCMEMGLGVHCSGVVSVTTCETEGNGSPWLVWVFPVMLK